MRRRSIVVALPVALAASASRLSRAQSRPELRRIGVLAPSTRAREEITLRPFFEEMTRLGWIEGRTVAYDRVYADDDARRLAGLAVELVARTPEIIFAPPSPAAVAARKATATIPIVFATGTDPVGTGLVADLARPGGNVTGVLSVVESLAPKLIEALREMLPEARRLGVLHDPADPRARIDLAALTPPAAAHGFALTVAEASDPSSLAPAIARLAGQKVEAIVTSTSLMYNLRTQLLQLTNRRGIPVAGHRAELAEAGAVLAYGAPLAAQIRRAAAIVDKILRGAKPAELPVEQPVTFELVVNRRAARALNVKLPSSLLVRADRIIE